MWKSRLLGIYEIYGPSFSTNVFLVKKRQKLMCLKQENNDLNN